MNEKEIIANIKKFRTMHGISLEQLAGHSGLTKGYLSKIENSEKAPPFSTLIKIAKALKVDITNLITGDLESRKKDVKLSIVRSGERQKVLRKGGLYSYHYESLAFNKPGKNMEPYLIIPAFEEKTVFSHAGEEFMYVLEGKHEFIYGNEKYILEKGDSIYFDSSVPHTGRSLGKKRAKILAVLYYYKRR